MSENIPILGRDLNIQVYEADRPNQNFNPLHASARHITTKLSQIKDKDNFKSKMREQKSYIRELL